MKFPWWWGFMLLVLSPFQSRSPLLLRLPGDSSSCVYPLMYRYICIDFGYLSVIVSSSGLMFSRPAAELAWICSLSPITVTICLSSPFLPPFASPYLHLSASSSVCVLLSHPVPLHCRSEASGQTLLWASGPASGPWVFWLSDSWRSNADHTIAA